MIDHWKRAALAAVLAVSSMTVATSADARDRWRDRDGVDALVTRSADGERRRSEMELASSSSRRSLEARTSARRTRAL